MDVADAMHCLSCITACQELVAALEATADRHPDLSEDIAEAVTIEKQQIEYYRSELGG